MLATLCISTCNSGELLLLNIITPIMKCPHAEQIIYTDKNYLLCKYHFYGIKKVICQLQNKPMFISSSAKVNSCHSAILFTKNLPLKVVHNL